MPAPPPAATPPDPAKQAAARAAANTALQATGDAPVLQTEIDQYVACAAAGGPNHGAPQTVYISAGAVRLIRQLDAQTGTTIDLLVTVPDPQHPGRVLYVAPGNNAVTTKAVR